MSKVERLGKTDLLEKYWPEFLEWWRQLLQEAKNEELTTDQDFGAIMGIMLDKDKFQKSAVYLEFKEPTETTFWKWYVLIKTAPKAKGKT